MNGCPHLQSPRHRWTLNSPVSPGTSRLRVESLHCGGPRTRSCPCGWNLTFACALLRPTGGIQWVQEVKKSEVMQSTNGTCGIKKKGQGSTTLLISHRPGRNSWGISRESHSVWRLSRRNGCATGTLQRRHGNGRLARSFRWRRKSIPTSTFFGTWRPIVLTGFLWISLVHFYLLTTCSY